MLAVGVLLATGAGVAVRFVRAVAEDIPMLALGSFRVVTFGQSFHWTDGERVAESVYEILEPGGTLALRWSGVRLSAGRSIRGRPRSNTIRAASNCLLRRPP